MSQNLSDHKLIFIKRQQHSRDIITANQQKRSLNLQNLLIQIITNLPTYFGNHKSGQELGVISYPNVTSININNPVLKHSIEIKQSVKPQLSQCD